ncbi:cupin domain-containing protein [Methylocella sp.]|uniref:cupin domain-containing protein n=1 Tax=Methylocella sp. TaxID=1978226 RepID=UPI0035B329A1
MSLPNIAPGARMRGPAAGVTYIFTHASENLSVAEFDVELEPGACDGWKPRHFHPNACEEIIVKRGRLDVRLRGERRELGEGESLIVPPGVPHGVRNAHHETTLFTARHRPGGQFLRFLVTRSLIAAENAKRSADGLPLLPRALILNAYPGLDYAAGIPIWAQKPYFAALAAIARRRGYSLPVAPRQIVKRGGLTGVIRR